MASHEIKSDIKNPVINWIDARMPIFTLLQKEYGSFPTPRNFNYLWNFGALAMFMLATMIATGIFLAMNYTADTTKAFDSVEHIMRDVNYGWLIRYLHMNGASMFFVVVYVHIFRGMYYGSYKKPRELLWILGVVILLLMMATAFMGYVLPWGQMSFWGATVITNLFSAIPIVGPKIVTWLWGGFSVDNPTLTRFFALHYLLPFVICAVVFLHVVALHITGSNNPLGIDPKGPQDTVPFHPYYTSKDIFGLGVFMVIYASIVFFAPNYMGHPDNYIEANPMVTPTHIVPEWYFLPFYAMLRSITVDIGIPFTHITLIPAKLGGVMAMFGSIAMLFVLPWLDRSPVRSALFRPMYRKFFWLLGLDCVILGFVGANPPEGWWVVTGQIATFWYFFHFLVLTPFIFPRYEKTLPVPTSIAAAVLKHGKAAIMLAVLATGALTVFGASSAQAQEAREPKHVDWQHGGLFGTFDRAQLQRGFQVYKEVCSACHSMHQMSYRNLTALGFSEEEVKAIASEYQVQDGPNDQGDMFMRQAKPSDKFHAPFANTQQAQAANGGALPKDLSLIVKAREGGEDYIYSLLTGFAEKPPADFKVPTGMYYNPYFPGNLIGMPPPLTTDGQVTYADGTKATVDQMARDVVSFLTWAAEPQLEARKQMGVKVILFLLAFTGIMYGVKRKVWSNLH